MPNLRCRPQTRQTVRLALSLMAMGGLAGGLTGVASAAQNAFGFAARGGVATGTYVTSETVTVSGFDGTLPVSLTDTQTGGADASTAQYSIDGGPFTTSGGQIAAGHTLAVRHLSAPRASTTRATQVSVGSYATTFQSTTTTTDTTPDAFDFGAIGNVNPSAWVESGVLSLGGFDGPLAVTPSSGAQFRVIGADGSSTGWLASGKISPGQRIAVRHTSASGKLVYTKSTYRIGTTSGSFLTRTQGPVSGSPTPSTTAPPASVTTAPPVATPPPVDLTKPIAAYLHDLSPKSATATFANARLEHYRIPVSDGTILDSWVRRPPGDANQPLVLVFTPYYGGGDPTLSPLGDSSKTFGTYLIPYGYAVGFVSVGGTGDSGGCFRDGGAIERQQLYDAVEYMAKQTWSNGKVASIGVSYDGTTASELFVAAPPSLKTVVPMEALTDYYRYTFHKGAIARADNTFFTTYYYPIVGAAPAGLEGGVGPTDPTGYMTELQGEPCPEQLSIQQEGVKTEASADKTPYWQERDAIALVNASPTKPRPAMLYIEGFQDANVDPQMGDGYLEAVQKTGVPFKALYGQWVHAYPQSSTACTAGAACRGDFWETYLLAWFDQFLKGKDTGILTTPAVQTEGDDGVWRHELAWPPKTSAMVLNPQAAGTLGPAAGKGTASYLDAGSNHYNESNTGKMVAYPEAPGASVEFVGDALPKAVRLTGLPKLTLAATSSGPRADVVVTLLERKADGTQRYLNFAALNLNHATSATTGATDVSNVPLTATLDFYPQDNVVAAGSRLVLHIGGDIATTHTVTGNATNFLNYGMNLQPLSASATVTLDLTKMSLTLPVNPSTTAEKVSWLP